MTVSNAALFAIGAVVIVAIAGVGAYVVLQDDSEVGTISIYVKDAPAEWSHVNVTFSVVKIHKADTGDNESGENSTDDGSGWNSIHLEKQTIDLAALVNVSELLATGNVSVGKYTQIRLLVVNVTGVMADGTNVAFKVPSGELKINNPFTIKADQDTTFTVDIDLGRSITHNANGWVFKPVLGSIVEV